MSNGPGTSMFIGRLFVSVLNSSFVLHILCNYIYIHFIGVHLVNIGIDGIVQRRSVVIIIQTILILNHYKEIILSIKKSPKWPMARRV